MPIPVERASSAYLFEAAAKQFEFRPEAIDRDFGVVPVDLKTHTYSVLVELSCADDPRAFSNPKIEPLKP
jgi:hypothetical protein